MGLHDQIATKAFSMGKKSKEFNDAAQSHANASFFFLIIAGLVWYFFDNWIWVFIPMALLVYTVLKSISSTLIALRLEKLEPKDEPE